MLAQRRPGDADPTYAISGRIVDPHKLGTQGTTLALFVPRGNNSSVHPVAVNEDGTFVTPRVGAGTYVLEIIKNWNSQRACVGFATVVVTSTDVSGVTVERRRDTALTGVYRMESDNPGAVWPSDISLIASLVLNDTPVHDGGVPEGAPGGRFILRNLYGPRILISGYSLAPDSPWWPSRVLLDGVDITNVPTDFSEHEGGRLEFWFTQHPARISGRVVAADGQAARDPWIIVAASDPTLWRQGTVNYRFLQGDAQGRFSVAVRPGAYRVRAVPDAKFDSQGRTWSEMREILQLTANGELVEVNARENKATNLTLRP